MAVGPQTFRLTRLGLNNMCNQTIKLHFKPQKSLHTSAHVMKNMSRVTHGNDRQACWFVSGQVADEHKRYRAGLYTKPSIHRVIPSNINRLKHVQLLSRMSWGEVIKEHIAGAEGDASPWQYTVWTAVCLRLRVMPVHGSTQSGQLSAWD